jgi:hypothetical protein
MVLVLVLLAAGCMTWPMSFDLQSSPLKITGMGQMIFATSCAVLLWGRPIFITPIEHLCKGFCVHLSFHFSGINAKE